MKLRREKQREFFGEKFSKLYHHDVGVSEVSKESAKEDSRKDESKTKDADTKAEDVYLIKCPKCGKMVDRARVVKKKYVCYECGGYFRVKVPNRIRMVADPHSFEPWFTDMPVHNPLAYEGYEEKLAQAREKTGLDEAVTVGRCKVFGEEIVLGICDARFMMASMGRRFREIMEENGMG